MVGDRAPDIIAGATFGLRTALLVGGDAGGAERAALAARDLRADVRGARPARLRRLRAGRAVLTGVTCVSRQTLRFFSRVWRRAGLWRSKCLK